ncbi:MAG: glycosyltransferase family 2 protein [Gemmataceae bacterium]
MLIPAHDEAHNIADTIRACLALDYPTDLCRIVVIADNCMDETADAAREAGATVLMRSEPMHPGKGAALQWALPQVLTEDIDAVAILDADCLPERQLLRKLNSRLAQGERVIQAAVVPTNVDDSPATYLACLGSILENYFVSRPKDRLGLSVFLRGTGMTFARSVLDANPWRATSAVEDHEFSLKLLRCGERVRFEAEAIVYTKTPTTNHRLLAQRSRWSAGLAGIFRTSASLLFAGIHQFRIDLIDAAISKLLMSRPLVLLQLACSLAMCMTLHVIFPSQLSSFCVITSLSLCSLHFGIIGAAMLRLGITWRRVQLCAGLPSVALTMMTATVRGLFGYSKGWGGPHARARDGDLPNSPVAA